MENNGNLKDDVEDFVETKINIMKLKAIDKAGSAASGAITGFATLLLALFILQFLSFSAAYAISETTGIYYLGFLIVAGFYVLVTVLLLVMREKIITMPIINALLAKFYQQQKS